MTFTDRISSAQRFLTQAQQQELGKGEAEKLAEDRHRAMGKDNGTLARLEAHWANLDQIRADSMSGGRR